MHMHFQTPCWRRCKHVLRLPPKKKKKKSMFCALHVSQNNQHLFESMHLIKNCSRNPGSQKGTEILVGSAVFKLWIKTVKMLFLDQ